MIWHDKGLSLSSFGWLCNSDTLSASRLKCVACFGVSSLTQIPYGRTLDGLETTYSNAEPKRQMLNLILSCKMLKNGHIL